MSVALRTMPVRAALATPRGRAYLRAAVGGGILLAIVLAVGAEPFLQGIAAVSPAAIAAAFALTAIAVAAAAWRWRVLARRLGLELGWREAIAAYYRSLLLNSVLPGGVVGDVHRAVAHGRAAGRIGQASRAVVAERASGQAVQLILTALVLVLLGLSAFAPAVGTVFLVVAALCLGGAVVAAVSPRARALLQRELGTLRVAFGSIGTVAAVVATSLVVIACHAATFVVACIAIGVVASPGRITATALIVALAGSIPFNLGGWGPREGAAAWAFAAAGLGAAAGVTASTTFGVLTLLSVTPGIVVIAASALRRRREPSAVVQERSAP